MSEPGSAATAAGDGPARQAAFAGQVGLTAGPETRGGGKLGTKPEPTPTPSSKAPKSPWWLRHYTFTGTAVGLIFIWFSMTPSLLPRGALFQGLVSGCSGASGYGLGVFAVWLFHYMRMKDDSPPPPRWAWKVLIPVGVVGMVLMAIWFHVWQDDVRDLMGVEHLKWYDYPFAAVLSLVVLFTLVEIGQLIRKLVSFLVGQLDRIAPFRVSATIVVVLLVVLTITLLNGVVVKFAMLVPHGACGNAHRAVIERADQRVYLRTQGWLGKLLRKAPDFAPAGDRLRAVQRQLAAGVLVGDA